MLTRKTKEISLKRNAVYVVKDEELHELESPLTGFGMHKIIWQDDKPIRVEVKASEMI